MIPPEISNIVFNVRINGRSSGTCFTLKHNSKRYLITARHILSKEVNSDIVEIETGSGWKSVNYEKVITSDNNEVDIVAFLLIEPVITDLGFAQLNYTSKGVMLAHDVYFFGYPYGLKNFNFGSQRGKSIVKKAMVSGVAYDGKGAPIGFILDGHNNQGFSGGPCLTRDY